MQKEKFGLLHAEFYRHTDEAESSYLQKVAKKDAWANLKQWFFPALGLSLLVVAYWLYRQEVLQGTKNLKNFSTLITLGIHFFVVLLHLVLVVYIAKLLGVLKHFGAHPTKKQGSEYAIYAVEGQPECSLSLFLTSRSGLRRYRWHYYLSGLPLIPLPEQRKILPLFAQKKSWTNFGEAEKEQQLEAFPEQYWLLLDAPRLRLHVVEVRYYDFRFYYLCAVEQTEVTAKLIEQGVRNIATKDYRLVQ